MIYLSILEAKIDNNYEVEFNEAKIQVMKIALLRLEEILN